MFTSACLRVIALGLLTLFSSPLAAQADPESWRLAVGFLQRGMHREAADQLRSFLKQAPRDAKASEACYRLGVCELELNEVEPAVASLERAARDRGLAVRPECLYRLGGALQKLGRPADAAARYEELCKAIDAGHYLAAAAHYGAGEAYRDAQDDGRALPHFDAAATAADEDPRGYAFAGAYQAGYVRLRAGDAAGAKRDFQKIVKRWPQHEAMPELQYLVGEAAHRSGDDATARRAWSAAAAAGGEWADDARSGLAAIARSSGDSATAIGELRRLVADAPDSPLAAAARVQLGQLLADSGDAKGALREVDGVLRSTGLAPELRSVAATLRGELLLAGGRAPDAIVAFDLALESTAAERAPRIHCLRGDARLAAGQVDPALADYAVAVRSGDEALRGDALYGQIRAYHAAGRHDDSIAAARRFSEELPRHRLAGHAAFAGAENLYAKQDYAAARTAYDAVGRDHELAPTARFKAAWSAWLAGDAPDAGKRFSGIAADEAQSAVRREEALSMQALVALTAGAADQALALADRYAAQYPQGEHLARTERVAARVLRDRDDLRGAGERLARAARNEKGDAAVALALERADVAFQGGDFESARRVYQQHVGRADAAGARALEGVAWCAFELGDDAVCRRAIRDGIAHAAAGEIAPALIELEVNLFQRREKWSEAATAARAFLSAFSKHPRAPEVEFALGTALSRAGDAAAAREVLARVVKADRCARADLAQYELAWVSRRCDDEKAARAGFARVVETTKDPELADECRVLVSESLLAADAREPAREILRSVKHATHQARALYLTGQSWLKDGDPAKAAAAFAAAAQAPGAKGLAADALFAAGETEHGRGRFAEASVALGKLVREHPDHARAARARLYLGECLVRAGRPEDAIGELERYLQSAAAEDGAAGEARARLWIGRAHLARKDYTRAERAFVAAAKLADGQVAAEATFRLGESCRARGDDAAAAESFMKVAILYADPEFVPAALLEAARSWTTLEQPEKAARVLDELIEKHPSSAAAGEAKKLRRGRGRRN